MRLWFAGKVVADQIVFAPVLLTTLFYSMARMEGKPHATGPVISGRTVPVYVCNGVTHIDLVPLHPADGLSTLFYSVVRMEGKPHAMTPHLDWVRPTCFVWC